MRKIWLAGAAAFALTLIGSAGAPAGESGDDLFAALCRNTSSHALAWRRGLQRMLTSAEAYAQTLPGDMNAPPPLVAGAETPAFMPAPCTAKVESCLSTFPPPHSGHDTACSDERTSSSKCDSHSMHAYS